MAGTDDYIADAEEGGISSLDIIHLFGKEKLEYIQRSLSKATGLAFVTVNFRGEPITEPTSFSKFCMKVRNLESVAERCKSSDAFGSIQAAVTKQSNVYFCPCGLLEMAVPIIVRGHYLGGFIGGQIRCNNAPDTVSRLSFVMHSGEADEHVVKYQEWMEEIPLCSYDKFVDIANLVLLVINQLSENEIRQHMQENRLKSQLKKIHASNQLYRKDLIERDREIQELNIMSNPYDLLDTLTSLMNLSIIENAPRTNEMLSIFIDYIKYNYKEKETFVPVSGELEQVERYLFIQQKKLGKRLMYSFQVPKNVHMQKIPSGILLPFIKNALYNGIMLKKEGGKIAVTGYAKNDNIVLEVSDNGPGYSMEELDIRFEVYKNQHEGYYIKLGMEYARAKMKQMFGESYDIIMEDYRKKGRKSILFWPEHPEERTE